jgi:serine/threonine protein kinase
MVNRTIRNFEIKELIATGGMAAIYKAVQVSLDRIVAVKILHGHLAQDTNFITRFEREAKAAANLKHENIVNIIDYGKANEVYFIAMEYVEGRSLKEVIASVKFTPYDIALEIAYEIGKGLWHAHQKGVVHRDIKPANILIGYDGIVKIADFGLAQAQDLTSVTITGSIVGTPAYMSPEQAGGKKVDFRTDIFSLGVLVYEMITGIKPFKGENYSSVIHEILTVKPSPPLEANPLIPREINDVIEKMLDKDPDQRYQSVAEVNQAISSYFKARNIEVNRAHVGAFITTPDELFQHLVKERKDKHFERAMYFMKCPTPKIDEAIHEFSKVVHLDPDDTQAQKYLADLKKKKQSVKAKKSEKKKPVEKKPRRFPASIVIIALVVLIAFVFVMRRLRRRPLSVVDSTIAYTVLDIRSIPDHAAIYIDNAALGLNTPARVDSLIAGMHIIRLEKAGYVLYADTINAQEGDTIALNATLVEEGKAAVYGSIRVTSTPAQATVFLDNVNQGLRTPCTLKNITEGRHTIRVVRKGYLPAEKSTSVTPGTTSEASLVLQQREEALSVKGVSYLKIKVTPWAKIYIDNRYVETTPVAQPLQVPSGTRTVRLENPNCKKWQDKVEFKPNQTVSLNITLQPIDGFLKLTVTPWADVYIDGKFYETTPIAQPIKLPAGRHTLKLINPSFVQFEQAIEIPANKMLKKFVELEPK